ncbi:MULTISPECIES: hypothetical protein [Streptomyces]|uniref:hypothetical protein n=1 Tax=Streptomyces TaxID=1883 RepID=UPI00224CD456|nr:MULTISPECIES: hypothetical protein [Streptomyces]MCX5275354.1 hypothetical protein [Streptomyces virginiae]MCX5582965.1 hypothetical protein [Streptomyces erythrochromogenes]
MRNIPVPVHVDRLNALADQFDRFRSELGSTAPLTGTDGLHQLSGYLRTSHELTAEALAQLTAINGSQVTQMKGALAALSCLAQIVQQAGLVSEGLTDSIAANAYDGATWDPFADADKIGRGLRHLDARKAILLHFGDAASSLEICVEGCRIVAGHLDKEFPAGTSGPTEKSVAPVVTSPVSASGAGRRR